MKLQLHVNHSLDGASLELLARLVCLLERKEDLMSVALDELRAALAELEADVTTQTDVTQSAVRLLEGLSAQLADAVASAVDLDDLRSRVQNLNASLDTQRNTLAAAVAANTPAQGEQGTVPGTSSSTVPSAEPSPALGTPSAESSEALPTPGLPGVETAPLPPAQPAAGVEAPTDPLLPGGLVSGEPPVVSPVELDPDFGVGSTNSRSRRRE